ncbi:type II toxin-antitoxin system RelE/ParE family toxin [Enterococcus pallens]|uniref:type II toxin-antitoxin system RelE/ParE family toxin n=1 Tax=Enterococcus pallens TaxID=160454 RepID=UPI0009DB72A1
MKTLLNRIYATISSLTNTPLIGTSLQTRVHDHTAYRFIIVESYIIFYKLIKDTIYVDRILSEKQDYLKILGF